MELQKETELLLREAQARLVTLQRRNEVLEAQNRVLELFGSAFRCPFPQQGVDIDFSWTVQHHFEALAKAEAEKERQRPQVDPAPPKAARPTDNF